METKHRGAWLRPCPEYHESTAGLTKVDAWIAVGLYVFAGVHCWLEAWWDTRHRWAGNTVELATSLGGVAVTLLVVALLLAARRQSWRTVGFATTHLRRSLLVGLALAVPMVAAGWLIGAATGHPATQGYLLTYSLPYYLIVIGFYEELIFRGFVTTRLAAAFRRPWVGVVVAGLLFAAQHFIRPLTMAGGDVTALALVDWVTLVIPLAWHFVLWWLYARYNSLAAPTLLHFAFNYAGELY